MLKEKYLKTDEKFEKLLYKTGMSPFNSCTLYNRDFTYRCFAYCEMFVSYIDRTLLSGVWRNESSRISVKRRFIKIFFISSVCVILCGVLHIIYGKGNMGIYFQ